MLSTLLMGAAGVKPVVTPPPSGLYMTVGEIPARPGYGPLYGFTSDAHYLEAENGGTLSYPLLRDMRDPENPKIVRLAGLMMQQGAYFVISFEELDGVPDPEWPQFTWILKVGEFVYNFSEAAVPSVGAPCIGRYIVPSPAPDWNPGTIGQTFQLEYV